MQNLDVVLHRQAWGAGFAFWRLDWPTGLPQGSGCHQKSDAATVAAPATRISNATRNFTGWPKTAVCLCAHHAFLPDVRVVSCKDLSEERHMLNATIIVDPPQYQK